MIRTSPQTFALLAAALLGASCNREPPAEPELQTNAGEATAQAPAGARADSSGSWDLQSSGEGVALVRSAADGRVALRLFCPAAKNQLLVNVPAFRPIGSEERLSVGSNDIAIALVADPRGDAARGGVTGAGPVPDEVKAIAHGPISVSYGAQRSGPHPVVPDDLARRFVTTCSESATSARRAAAEPTAATHPCHVQDGRLIRLSMRALGTEPFWNAKIDGRCVTYSTPENQSGTRIWTKVGDGPDGPIFAGAYQGRPFNLIVRPKPGCSDGMSDRRFEWEATLTVNGETRRGCGETIASGR